jgi:SAM-dependent methyltransferase
MSEIEVLSPASPVLMADEWFEFATADHFWMQWRHRVLLRALRRAGPIRRALEIGCGHGVVREMLERDLGFPVDGCDLNRQALEMAKPGKGRLFVYNILEQQPSMLGRYDAVFLLDVIEHVADDAAFLCAALRHLRPGGWVVVNVPASMLLFSDYDRVAGHLRRYSARTLATLLERCGVEAAVIEPWGFSMVPALLVRKVLLGRRFANETIRRGFMPPNRLSRWLMHGLKNIETALPFTMPFGTSLLASGRFGKPSNE